MSAIWTLCRWCRRRALVRLATDGRGRVVQGPTPCGCEASRLAGRCIDCRDPVEGQRGKALRCGPCKKAARSGYSRRWREKYPERWARVQAAESRKKKTAAGRARRRECERARRAEPEFRERRNARRRAIALTARGRAQRAEQHRKYKERHPDRVKAQTDRANARRTVAKREYMHLYATRYVGEGKRPSCRACGAEVPWGGCGRPRLECPTCRRETRREVAA